MQVETTKLDGVLVLEPRCFDDSRGFFFESYNERTLLEHGVTTRFVQDNHSYSFRRGTIRGLHFQREPHAQAKLVRVTRGAVIDYAVDIRPDSQTFGRYVGVELSAANRRQLLIPAGFAHGFCTLADDTEVLYKASDFYAPAAEGGIVWNDCDLAIDWPVPEAEAILSERDCALPGLTDALRC